MCAACERDVGARGPRVRSPVEIDRRTTLESTGAEAGVERERNVRLTCDAVCDVGECVPCRVVGGVAAVTESTMHKPSQTTSDARCMLTCDMVGRYRYPGSR